MEPNPTACFAYVDGATPTGGKSLLAGVGVSLRDERGEFLTISRPVSPSLSNHRLECVGIETALTAALEMGYTVATVHCDCEHVVWCVTNGPVEHDCRDSFERIWRLRARFNAAHIVHAERHDNERAHGLARAATYLSCEQVTWRKEVPR